MKVEVLAVADYAGNSRIQANGGEPKNAFCLLFYVCAVTINRFSYIVFRF